MSTTEHPSPAPKRAPRCLASAGKALAALALFALPFVALNPLLLDISLNYRADLTTLEKAPVAPMRDRILLVGDCTISPYLHFEAAPGFDDMKELQVLGFGGSSIEEWYYLLRNNFGRFQEASTIVIGTAHAYRFRKMAATYTGFLPVIMTWGQIWQAVAENRITLAEGHRFALARLLNSYMASQVLRYRLLDHILPGYSAWHQARNLLLSDTSRVWRVQNRPPEEGVIQANENYDIYFERVAQLTRSLGGRMVFLLNPRAAWMRTKEFQAERAAWLAECQKLGVRCLDRSEALPDSEFPAGGDGLHLGTPESLASYWRSVRRELASSGGP